MQVAAERSALLRREVGLLRGRESRRLFDAMVSVGRLSGDHQSFVVRAQDLPAVDTALRVDVVTALLGDVETDAGEAWVTRPGSPEPHDMDLHWLAAAITAFGIHGRALLGFYAITRAGWLDVRSGERRVWKRLRL